MIQPEVWVLFHNGKVIDVIEAPPENYPGTDMDWVEMYFAVEHGISRSTAEKVSIYKPGEVVSAARFQHSWTPSMVLDTQEYQQCWQATIEVTQQCDLKDRMSQEEMQEWLENHFDGCDYGDVEITGVQGRKPLTLKGEQ